MKLFAFTICALAGLAVPAFSETTMVDLHGQALVLEMPAGMCDITDTAAGSDLLEYLESGSQVDVALPLPYVVYADCAKLTTIRKTGNFGYPWGYIGLPRRLDPMLANITQAQINGALQAQAETDAMQEFLDTVNQNLGETRREWLPGVEIEELRGYISLLANEAVFVGYMKVTGNVDGEPFLEHALFSSTILDGIMINYYIYENEEGTEALPDHVKALDAAAITNVQAGL